jgi:hypothetical protein
MAPPPKLTTIPSRDDMPVPCRGIDQRSLQTSADPSSVFDAPNCDLTDSGGIRMRDALVEFAELPPGTLGLYALGGTLRVAVPAGHGIQSALPASIHGDVVGEFSGAPTPIGRYERLSSFTSWGAGEDGALPYLVLRTTAGIYVHHWINVEPTLPTRPVLTKVDLGFLSGPDVVKAKQHIFAVNISDRVVQHSSTVFGPAVWSEDDAPDDAGFIAVNEQALSDSEITGLTMHQGRLAVVFANSIQFWEVFADPALNKFATALNGPGTNVFGSLKPVIGDMFYFSEGGFQSLATQTQTGELREQGFGAPVRELTKRFITWDPDEVVSLWSQARAQYLCAFNDEDTCEVFAYKWLPAFNVSGFTRWRLPVRVDYWAELNGILYIRSGDMVYQLSPDAFKDEIDGVQQLVDAWYETQFVDGGAPRNVKQFLSMDVTAEGTYDVAMLVDKKNRTLTEQVALALTGSTQEMGEIPLGVMLHSIALRITMKNRATIEQIQLSSSILTGIA